MLSINEIVFVSFALNVGKSTSQYFSIANGVRQGSILFPKLFALYMDGLSGAFSLYKADCYINDQCMDRLIYADDILGYEPADLTVHPPPRTAEGGFIFFV